MAADERRGFEPVDVVAAREVDPPQDAGDQGAQDGQPADDDEDGRDACEASGVTLQIHGSIPPLIRPMLRSIVSPRLLYGQVSAAARLS
jgi:hypothetical protein